MLSLSGDQSLKRHFYPLCSVPQAKGFWGGEVVGAGHTGHRALVHGRVAAFLLFLPFDVLWDM